jgi:hypothetical protein
MQIVFTGRLQGVYQPKDPSKFPRRVPLNVVGRGVIQIGPTPEVGVTLDQVQGYRATLWVDADDLTAVYDRLAALVGRDVSYVVDHELTPQKVAGAAVTQLVWRDSVQLDSLAVE